MQIRFLYSPRFQVLPFGNDCLGNCTGYRVVDTRSDRKVIHQFVGNIYREGSYEEARTNAQAAADVLNKRCADEAT